METLNNKALNNTVKILCGLSVIAMIFIGITSFKADVSGLIIFLAFIVFYVQLPGLFIIRMLRMELKHISTSLCIGLFTGWAFNLIVFFITDLIGTTILMYAAGPILSALYIAARLMNRCEERNHFHFSKLSTAFCIFVVLAFLFSMLNNQYLYLSPEYSKFTFMNPDKGYHLGLIASLSHGWPLECPWIHGRQIYYHIFTEMLYSIPMKLFGIPADVLLLSCGPYFTVYAFGLSLYTLFNEMTSKGRAGLYCMALMLSNIFIAKGPDKSLAFFFVFRNENATAYGVASLMAAIILLKYWNDSRTAGKKSWNYLICMIAVVMLSTGIKGPMGLTFIGALWGTYILGIILRKVKLRTILPILLITIGFIVVYVVILGSKGQSNGSGNSMIALATITDVAYYKTSLVAWLKAMGLPTIARLGILLVVFTGFTLTAFTIPFVVGYLRELVLILTGKKEFDLAKVQVYAICMVGFIAMFILNYSGHSQVYFGYAAVFLAPLVSFWFFEDMEGAKGAKGVLTKIIAGIFIVTLLITSVGLASHYKALIYDSKLFAADTISYSPYECISHDEYEAMLWIKDNTPEDSLLAVDRYYSDPLDSYSVQNRWNNRFFLYADYSNRFCYLGGSGYNLPAADWPVREEMIEINNQFYDVNNEERGDLAREIGIDYVVVSKNFTDVPNLENEDYSVCFSNDDVVIYEIKGE